jgi:glutamate---cysteine ligase / carboxylate-amine ligase
VGLRAVGVEEELLVIDAATGAPVRAGDRLVRRVVARTGAPASRAEDGSGMHTEFMREQVEIGTPPCRTLSDLRGEVLRLRRMAVDVAAEEGLAVAAVGTSPVPVSPTVTADPRYLSLLSTFRLVAGDQLINGCHVHVDVASRAEAIGAMDRLQPWLPLLRALSANSPFWRGRDSGYASYRSEVWGRWPSAGPTEPFGTPERYDQMVRALLATGAVVDRGNLYFDARPSERYRTVEIRVADVCLDPEDTVLLAGLARALVDTAAREWRDAVPDVPTPVALLRTAHWRAAREGVGGLLQHPLSHLPVPAPEALRALLAHGRDALERSGDRSEVEARLDQVIARGSGARAQRTAFHRRGHLADVARHAATVTAGRDDA